ncbi:MAG: pilus assembly protein PilM [Lachnospiraceae bacterium]|nr:pilus assembly protein PilM [Lachnospiraceae bacterium]
MAKNGKVLSIDITNESITIIEITASAKKQTLIHNVLIFETPEDSFEDGNIKDAGAIAQAIRQQLTSRGINNKNAIFTLSSTKIVNREVLIPFVKENKIRGIINANSSEYFPVNIEDYVVSHSILETVTDDEGNKQLRILAVAAPRHMVGAYYDLASMAGLTVVDMDYIGNAMLQLIKTQTTANSTTMVIQLGSESSVLNIVQGDNLLLQRTVPYGTNSVVNVVMDDKGVDATTAMTLLQNERIITVDFDDNEATGAFRYLINNIGRVMDFYASRNPDKPIEDVFLTGDGALIKGIDGLFKIQLNVQTRIMDNLYNIKFADGIDLKVYNPVYLVTPIGAAFDPMGFSLDEKASSSGAAGGAGEGSIAPFVAIFAIAAIGAAAMAFFSITQKKEQEDRKNRIEQDIARVQDIENVLNELEASNQKLADVKTMEASTYQANENFNAFITQFEACIPEEIVVQSISSNNSGVNFPCEAASHEAIADFIIQLKNMTYTDKQGNERKLVEDVYINGVAKNGGEDGEPMTYVFNLTAKYVDNNPYVDQQPADEAAAEQTTEQ